MSTQVRNVWRGLHRSGIGFVQCALMASILGMTNVAAQTTDTPAQQTSGTELAGVADQSLRTDAPQTYVVRSGDTLWSIAQRFLKSPWNWQQLWDPNRQAIPNPDLIYPGQQLEVLGGAGQLAGGGNAAAGVCPAICAGQTLKLSKNRKGRTVLRFGQNPGDNVPTVKLSPRDRLAEPEVIPTVSLAELEPFFTKPLIVEPADLQRNPRIVALDDQHVLNASTGERIFIRGDLRSYGVDPQAAGRQRKNFPNEYFIYRPSKPILDPSTKAVLAYESEYIGHAKLEKANQPPDNISTLLIVRNDLELQVGDYVVPRPPEFGLNFGLVPLKQPVQGNVAAVYAGIDFVARNSVVTLNRGARHGLVPGNVLSLWRLPGRVVDQTGQGKASSVTLPALRNGALLVFRVFDNVSYALVTNLSRPANVGDLFTTPIEGQDDEQ